MPRVVTALVAFVVIGSTLRADLVTLRFRAFNAQFNAYIADYDDGPPLWVQFSSASDARAVESFAKVAQSWVFADRPKYLPPAFMESIRIDLVVETSMQRLKRIGETYFPAPIEVALKDWSIAEPFEFIIADYGDNGAFAVFYVESVEMVFGPVFAAEERTRFVRIDPEKRRIMENVAGRTAEGTTIIRKPLDADTLKLFQDAATKQLSTAAAARGS